MIALASSFALYQLPLALVSVIVGTVCLVIGLTGVLFGWHRRDTEN
jgi:hypothetical protein